MLDGKVALITGAGQGIGFEIASKFAQNGAQVVINDRDLKLGISASEKIQNQGGKCISISCDVSNPDKVKELVLEVVSIHNKLDIVVANAGLTNYGDFFSFKTESLREMIQLNIEGSFFLTQAAALRMVKQGFGGRIILLSSVVGHQSYPNLTGYAMTKAAIEMLARSLVSKLSPFRITINALAPGATLTERTIKDDPDYISKWGCVTPMGRPAFPEDIANTAVFFASSEAEHITGQTLLIDGGWTCISPII